MRSLVLWMIVGFSAGAHGATIVSMVGDQDALGTGTAPGSLLPVGPFDHRSAAELAATDGSQNTDLATSSAGLATDNVFLHSFALTGDPASLRAVLELGIGGMQSNDSNPSTVTLGEDALRIDGILVAEAFAGVDQGPTGYGILRIHLPAALMALLLDGQAAVEVDLNSNAGFGPANRVEPVFYDFSRLTVSQVPEPSTTAVLLVLGAAAWLRRKARA